MEQRVLKLNQAYQPIEIINWKRAIKLILLGKAEVIKKYDCVISYGRLNVPSVIRLIKSFHRPKIKVKFNKHNVFARDSWQCQYCNQVFSPSELTIDHVLPRSRGGKSHFANVVTCCKECNSTKGGRTPQEANMLLHKNPTIPEWIPILTHIISKNSIPESWKDFCYLKNNKKIA
jgi:5-methylcytosine-specific restriction endonuclease McrA